MYANSKSHDRPECGRSELMRLKSQAAKDECREIQDYNDN